MTTLVFPSDSFDDIVDEFGDTELSEDARELAREICKTLDNHHYSSGRSPVGLAAAAIYAAALAHNDHLSQSAVSNRADISVVTVRSHYLEVVVAWGEANEEDLNREEAEIAKRFGAEIELREERVWSA